MNNTACTLGLTLALLAPATTALAQSAPAATSMESKWAPWLGCWEIADETIGDGSSDFTQLLGMPATRTRANAGTMVCVASAGGAGATMTTMVGDRSVLTETIVADGAQKALAEPDCRGWQRAEWSQLGPRLYASAEIACAGQSPRKVSGMAMMMTGPTWLDIQLIETGAQKSLRVRRYQRARDQGTPGAPTSAAQAVSTMPLARRLSIADVKEASAKVAPDTLQAALLELQAGFDLKGKQLIELDEANVPRTVIDLMVALSYPDRFVVDRPSRGGGGGSSWGYTGLDDMWPYLDDPYRWTSYYAPFGYRYWGYFDPSYFYGPGFVIVNPGPGAPPSPEPSGAGRVVDGRGYTRVRRADPVNPRAHGDGKSGTASSAASGNGSSGSNSGSSGSGVSSGGNSGGGGGGGRTAQPRRPGR